MTPILLSGPATEPISLAEAKSWLRVDSTADDQLIAALITSARLIVEATTRRMLITQSWRLLMDRWPRFAADDDWFTPRVRFIMIPLAPVQAVVAVSIANAAGAFTPLAANIYGVDARPDDARIFFEAEPPTPASLVSGIAIDLKLGYGDQPTAVPEPLRLAIRMLVARWYENRRDAASDAEKLPTPIGALVAPWVRARLR